MLAPRAREFERAIASLATPPRFGDALQRANVGVIAEVKRSSPSKGAINLGMDVERQLRAYEAGGAAAISILTEPQRFGGSNDDLTLARRCVRLPLLKKDFHVDVVQILEARALGASAALVIARAVGPDRLKELVQAGRESGIEILVEVRDEREQSADEDLDAEPEVVGAVVVRDLAEIDRRQEHRQGTRRVLDVEVAIRDEVARHVVRPGVVEPDVAE